MKIKYLTEHHKNIINILIRAYNNIPYSKNDLLIKREKALEDIYSEIERIISDNIKNNEDNICL